MNLIGKTIILKHNQDNLLKGSKVKIIDKTDFNYIVEVIEGKWDNDIIGLHTCHDYFKERIGYYIDERNIDINKLILDERKKKLKSKLF
jgi:hypothetical protein